MSQSPIQRFVRELRRRHVPQTTAIYLVAAWAVIQFADVVVPNLNGPQWMVTAVIVASLVGFPVMLVLAWIFEMGPGGIHRTDEADAGAAAPETGETGATGAADLPGRRAGDTRSGPWLAVAAILIVGIGSALGVAYVLRGEPEPAAPASGPDEPSAVQGLAPGGQPAPGVYRMGTEMADSIQEQVLRAMDVARGLDSLDLSGLAKLGEGFAVQAGQGLVVFNPEQWRPGVDAPMPLAEGDTLQVTGMAADSAGIVRVSVDGSPIVVMEQAQETIRFTASIVGTGSAGTRTVAIVAETGDDREIRREFEIVQLPGGTP